MDSAALLANLLIRSEVLVLNLERTIVCVSTCARALFFSGVSFVRRPIRFLRSEEVNLSKWKQSDHVQSRETFERSIRRIRSQEKRLVGIWCSLAVGRAYQKARNTISIEGISRTHLQGLAWLFWEECSFILFDAILRHLTDRGKVSLGSNAKAAYRIWICSIDRP